MWWGTIHADKVTGGAFAERFVNQLVNVKVCRRSAASAPVTAGDKQKAFATCLSYGPPIEDKHLGDPP
jgi:ribosomal protein L40E